MFTNIPVRFTTLTVFVFVALKIASPQYAGPSGSYFKYYMPRELAAEERRGGGGGSGGGGGGEAEGALLVARSQKSEGGGALRQLGQYRNLAEQRQQDELEALFEGAPDISKQIFPEYTESLPGSWDREVRELEVQKHFPICHLERKIVNLNTIEYEYRPAYYEEIKCTQKYHESTRNEICSSLGFSCFQWNKTIHLTRRRYSSDCWETKTMVIPAGCECMWPTHRLGDIKLHI